MGATYHVTTPDGATYEVNAPDGATQQDAIDYVRANQSQLKALPPTQPSAAAPQAAQTQLAPAFAVRGQNPFSSTPVAMPSGPPRSAPGPNLISDIGDAVSGALSKYGNDAQARLAANMAASQRPLQQQILSAPEELFTRAIPQSLQTVGDAAGIVGSPLAGVMQSISRPPADAWSDMLYNAGIPTYADQGFLGGPPSGAPPTRAQSRVNAERLLQQSLGLIGPEAGPVADAAALERSGALAGVPEGAGPPRASAAPTDAAPSVGAPDATASGPPRSAQIQPPPAPDIPVADTANPNAPQIPANPAGAPVMPPDAAARPSWMPTDEEIDASGIPSGPPRLQPNLPEAGATGGVQPSGASPVIGPDLAPTGAPDLSGASDAPPGATPAAASPSPGSNPAGLPVVSNATAPALAMTRERLAAWKMFERDMAPAGGADALAGARPWQTAAEATGNANRDLLQALAGRNDLPTGFTVNNLVAQRLAAIPDAVRGASQDFLDMSPQDAAANVREYTQNERAFASPQYEDELFNPDVTPTPDSPLLRELAEHPLISRYLNKAVDLTHRPNRPAFDTVNELQLPDGLPSGGRLGSPMGRRAPITGDDAANASLDQFNPSNAGVTPTSNMVRIPTMRTWDTAKQLMDDDVDSAFANGDKKRAVELGDLRSWLVKNENGGGVAELDRLVPRYPAIRAAGGTAPSAEAYAAGADRMFGDPYKVDKFTQDVMEMTVPQKRALIAGHLDRLENFLGTREIGAMPGNKNLAQFVSPNYQTKLSLLVGNRGAAGFVNALRDIEASRQSALELLPTVGSKSARILAAQKLIAKDMQGGLPTGEEIGDALGDVRKAAGKMVGNALTGAYNGAAVQRSLPVMAERGRIMSLPADQALAEYKAFKAVRGGRGGKPAASGPPRRKS